MSGPVCQERLLLPEALRGLLAPEQERAVLAHLETCPACQSAAEDIEVAMVSLALLRAERPALGLSDPEPAMAVGVDDDAVPRDELGAARARRHRLRLWVGGIAAAPVLVAAGIGVGHQVLPPRDTETYGPALTLRPPAGATDAAARGTVAVAADQGTLAVHLRLSGLPGHAWFECLWVAGGQTRSAGSFLARSGAVDVDLKVAPPGDAGRTWDLQVVAHSASGSQVVLEGATAS